jgi:hypothetical protein
LVTPKSFGKPRGRPFQPGWDRRRFGVPSLATPSTPTPTDEETAATVLESAFGSESAVAPLTAAERRQKVTGREHFKLEVRAAELSSEGVPRGRMVTQLAQEFLLCDSGVRGVLKRQRGEEAEAAAALMPPPGPPRQDSYGHQILGPTTWAEFKIMLTTVVVKLNKNKKYFRACVYRRGLGADAYRRWFHTPGYQAIKDNIKPYDIVKLSQRGTLVEPSLSPPLTRALSASYARWWYQNAVAGMLPISPPPGPAGRVGTDGTEDTCRCCGKGKTKGNATGELLCCEAEGCTAAWHFSCLLMKVPPRGSERWECPGCALAPRRKCHPQWPTVAEEKKRREKGLVPAEPEMNLLASDSEDED